jgi:hypothetical protein
MSNDNVRERERACDLMRPIGFAKLVTRAGDKVAM